MLEQDRVKEEVKQVEIERTNIQMWLREEWEGVEAALNIKVCHIILRYLFIILIQRTA
jgi:hypothetical protein